MQRSCNARVCPTACRYAAFLLLVAATAAGCGGKGPLYKADLAAGAADSQAAVIVVSPTIRLDSVDGEAVPELPVVGVRDLHKDKGTHRRALRVKPGERTVVAGIGPFFIHNYGQNTSGAGVVAGVGGGMTVGVGGGGTMSATFRYPGSEVDQEVAADILPGAKYRLDYLPDLDNAEGPGWKLALITLDGDADGSDVAEVVATRDSQHGGEPYRRYFGGK